MRNLQVSDFSRGSYRVEVTCAVQFLGPLHVGSGESLAVSTDAPIVRDSVGRPLLLGSSVRGVLRDWCEREAPVLGIGPATVARLFGSQDGVGSGSGSQRLGRGANAKQEGSFDRQGRLTVFGAALKDLPPSEIRDHVRIDSRWGAAADGAKFDEEILHCRQATFGIVYEGDSADDPELVLLRSALDALRAGALSFGGRTGWGYGWAEATSPDDIRLSETVRSDAGQLSEYLCQRLGATISRKTATKSNLAKGQPIPIEPDARALPWSWLRVDLDLQFEGPMLVAGPDRQPTGENRSADAVYLSQIDESIVLPGSSWRGVLRSHASRIALTLGCPDVAQLLFGFVEDVKAEPDAVVDNKAVPAQQGLLRVGDGKIIGRDGKELAPKDVATIWMDHVAIDRITGFAADQKLFNCLALASPRFRAPMLVRWHPGQDDALAAVALLLYALRDAETGLIWVGSRTTRGYGFLKSVEIRQGALSRLREAPAESSASPGIGTVRRAWTRAATNSFSGVRVADLGRDQALGPVVVDVDMAAAWNRVSGARTQP